MKSLRWLWNNYRNQVNERDKRADENQERIAKTLSLTNHKKHEKDNTERESIDNFREILLKMDWF